MRRYFKSMLGWLALMCGLILVAGCTDTESGPSTGSESHWLTCNTHDDCPTGQECVGRRCAPADGYSPDSGDTPPGRDVAGEIYTCTGEWGGCTRSDDGGYACDCGYYGAPRTSRWSDCERALRSCDPTSNVCGGFQGFCDQVDDASPPGVQCHCANGEAPFRSYDNLGHDDCDAALVEMCGADEPPPGYSCGSIDNQVTKNCEITGKAEDDSQGALQFSCTCSITCPEEQGDIAGSVVANTCSQALERICSPDC